jgi:hypothetical protein
MLTPAIAHHLFVFTRGIPLNTPRKGTVMSLVKGDHLRFMDFLDMDRITRCHIMQIIRVGDLSSRASMDYILSEHQHQIHG